MSESVQHQKLVRMLIEEVANMVGVDKSCFIESDINDGHSLPQLTNEGYRPDVLFQYEDLLIVGEAKTSNDIERTHSIMQYESYMRKCSLFQGKAFFIIAVPWMEYATIYNITKRIKRKYPGSYSIKIIRGIDI